jgi:hypothetical protein
LRLCPTGWTVITDKKKTCRYAVPPDWTQDKLMTTEAIFQERIGTWRLRFREEYAPHN